MTAASWGTWSLFLRPTGLPATISAPILFATMGLFALPLALRAPRVAWDRRTIALVLANGAFDAVNIVAFFAAIEYTTVAIAVLSHYAAPIVIAILAPRIDGASARGVVSASLVAALGLVLVLEPWNATGDGAVVGATLGLLSATCYAGNVFIVRRLAVRIGAGRAMSYHSLVAAIVLAPFGIAGASEVSISDLGLLVTGAITIGAISGIVFANGLVRIGAARAAVLTYAEPLVAVAVGALVWNEPLPPLAAVGGAMVLGAGIHVARKAR
ncbi:MAG: DMT family transporter [Kofleriaceae bacterium]